MSNFDMAVKAATNFHRLAMVAAVNGGFWVSAGGGTANVVAGIISRFTGVSYEDAHHALNLAGGEDWYRLMAMAQPWRWDAWHDEIPGRWDAKTIARAACRRVALGRDTGGHSKWSDKYAIELWGLW